MTREELVARAAQCWCDPRTSHLVMESARCEVFIEALERRDEQRAEIEALKAQLAKLSYDYAEATIQRRTQALRIAQLEVEQQKEQRDWRGAARFTKDGHRGDTPRAVTDAP